MNLKVSERGKTGIAMLLVLFACACHTRKTESTHYPTGNAVQDYFYKNNYAFPFYVDSVKPLCRKEDSLRIFGSWNNQRVQLAKHAASIIRAKFADEQALKSGSLAYAVFPVTVYFIDSPDCWYRVQLKEYRNNTSHLSAAESGGQLCDSGRILTRTRNIELLINDDGTVEYQCDQEM